MAIGSGVCLPTGGLRSKRQHDFAAAAALDVLLAAAPYAIMPADPLGACRRRQKRL
jgi:hypothetical protein